MIEGVLLNASENAITVKKSSAGDGWVLYGAAQDITLENLSGAARTLQLNGRPVKLDANEKKIISLTENLLDGREKFYQKDFLNEPDLDNVDCYTPY